MKKGLFVSLLVLIFSLSFVSDSFCLDNSGSITNPDSIIKMMLLINDAKKILPQDDPYAITQIIEKITIEMKYVDFCKVSDVQLKLITNLISENIASKQKEVQQAVLTFAQAFTQNAERYINMFLKNKELRKVIMSFAQQMLKILPGLIAKNPSLISQLITIFQGMATKLV